MMESNLFSAQLRPQFGDPAKPVQVLFSFQKKHPFPFQISHEVSLIFSQLSSNHRLEIQLSLCSRTTMCKTSPSKILRNVKRITRFMEQKPKQISTLRKSAPLSMQNLPQTNIDPLPPKILAFSRLETISIPHSPKKLSYRRFPTTEIVPGIKNDDEYLFSSYINGGSHLTTFVCHFCYDEYSFKSADTIRYHIQTEHGIEMYQRLKSKPPYEPEFEDLNW